MTIKTDGGAPAAADADFDNAFAQFATPGDGVPADPAPAPDTGGKDDGGNAGGDPPAAPAASNDGDTPAANSGDGGATPPAGDQGGDPNAAPAAAPEAPAADGGAPASGQPAGGETPAAPAAPAGPTDVDAVLDRLGKLVEAAQKPAEPASAPAAAAPAEQPQTYTPEQQAELAQYDKDWPEVAKFEAMKRSGEYRELLGFVFAEVQKYVEPIKQLAETVASRAHLADVKAAVPDYSDNLRQQVIDWVKTQPPYLQPAYDHVIQNGTHDEVKDLVERYRQATGQAAPAPGGAPAAPTNQAPARTNELSGAAKEAVAALAPVESKRSAVMQPSDPSNFDDAWSQFSKDLA